MKHFLIRLLTFTALIASIFALAEWTITQLHEPFNIKRNYFLDNTSEIDVLVLGSSQSHCSINPAFLSDFKAANMAQGGQSYEVDSMIYQKYIDDMSSLEFVILECSFHNLEWEHDTAAFQNNRYLRFFGLNTFNRRLSPLDYSLLASSKKQYLKILNPLNRTHRNINEYGSITDLESVDKNAHRFFNLNYDEKEIAASDSRFIKRHEQRNLKELEKNKRRLNSIIQDALGRQIKVVIIRPPLYKTYIDLSNKDKAAASRAYLDSLAMANSELTIIDYNETLDLDVTDFINEDHVNYLGAEKVSSHLNEVLLKLRE